MANNEHYNALKASENFHRLDPLIKAFLEKAYLQNNDVDKLEVNALIQVKKPDVPLPVENIEISRIISVVAIRATPEQLLKLISDPNIEGFQA